MHVPVFTPLPMLISGSPFSLNDCFKASVSTLHSIEVRTAISAWFGQSIGPYQHFSKAIYRAVEEGIFIARSANKGISAFINPNGRVLKSLNARESGNIELNFPYFNRSTLFSNYGNKIFFLIILLYIFLTLIFKKLKI